MNTIFCGWIPLFSNHSIIWYWMVVFPTRRVPVRMTVRRRFVCCSHFIASWKANRLYVFAILSLILPLFHQGLNADSTLKIPSFVVIAMSITSYAPIVTEIFIVVNKYSNYTFNIWLQKWKFRFFLQYTVSLYSLPHQSTSTGYSVRLTCCFPKLKNIFQ